MQKQTVKDVALQGKKVIVRVDFNVPLDKDLKITDDRRIRAALPTLQYILKQNPAKVILMSHLGRPKGEVIEAMRLTPVGQRLEELLGEKVLKLADCIGPDVETAVNTGSEKVILA